LFWCDSQSQLDYEAFGDVVVFDSTYKTNRYNLPFVPFVGLNHHWSTVIFGCRVISHETGESYEWMLRAFSEAMSQKHPVSVITDGDLAMQRAIRVVWPNANHRLCGWHIELNIVRNVHDDKVKEELRSFLYETCRIEESERKWHEFLERHKVTSEESWLHQMYQMRHLWCAAYLVGRCFLGLRSNQQSESLNSVLHTRLDRKMSLFDMYLHYERCLSGLRRNEAKQDSIALNFKPFTTKDTSKIEVETSKQFTPTVFALVQWSIHAANNCIVSDILDGCDTTFIVAKKYKMETKYEVHCKMIEGSLNEIACSCQKLECVGTPCSHIFHVLQLLHVDSLPKSCVLDRWTRNAKCAFPPIRKSNIYDYSKSLVRYRDLRNLSHAASFRAAQSSESYQRLKRVLLDETDSKSPCASGNERIRYGPMVAQALEVDCGKVLDPMHVPGRGAPKKKLKALNKKERAKVKCTLCKDVGHNRLTCSKRKEVLN
jgi:zinc finger SWIM domain-containing protein 3